VALALSLPREPERDALITITYVVVVFSILVQGLTVRRISSMSEPPAVLRKFFFRK
jgi:CPA1 family monovalent cation:H+ antiporter